MNREGFLFPPAALAVGCALALAGPAHGADHDEENTFDTEYENIRLVQVADGLSHPWAVAHLPDGRYLVTERDKGRLLLIDDGELTEVSGTPQVSNEGQGGLLDVVLHPNYAENGWIYLTYSKPADPPETKTALGRGRLEGSELVDWEELFEQDRASSPGRHYGSRLAWMADGTLLMTVGDRGVEPARAQDLADHAGSVLRLTETGEAPEDNPFHGQDDVLPEIYSYGHRNIQGMVIHPETGDVWVAEHGPRGGDELNRVEAGENHGWPEVSLGFDYETAEPMEEREARRQEGMVDPVHEFLPTLAPSGLALVSQDMFPSWQGNLMVGGLIPEHVQRIVLGEGEVLHTEALLTQEIGRIRDVREGPDGNIYLLNDEEEAGLYRLDPAD